jgi:hypothetical protein
MNGEGDALVRSLPRSERRPCGEGILGIDDTVARLGECPAQRPREEDLVPTAIPRNGSGSTADHDREPKAEDRHGERA